MARKTKKKYILSRESIDMISSDVHAFLGGYSVENPIIIQVRLALEELLLVLMNAISGSEELKLTLMKRAKRLWIKIDYKGRRFDPTNRDVLDNFSQNFLDMLRIKPIWKYQRGVNLYIHIQNMLF